MVKNQAKLKKNKTANHTTKPTPFWNKDSEWLAGRCLPIGKVKCDPDILDLAIDTLLDKQVELKNKADAKRVRSQSSSEAKKRQKLEDERERYMEEIWNEKEDMEEEELIEEMAAWDDSTDQKLKTESRRAGHKREKDEAGRRCKVIRIFPSQAQESLLNKFFEATRIAHNKVISYINKTKETGLQDLRFQVGLIKGMDYKEFLPKKLRLTPRDVIDQTVRDCKKDCNSWIGQLQQRLHRKIWRQKYADKRADEKKKGTKKKDILIEFSKKEADAIEKEILEEFEKQKKTLVFKTIPKDALKRSLLLSSRLLDIKTKDGELFPLFGRNGDRSAMKCEKGHSLPDVYGYDTRLIYHRRFKSWYLCINTTMPHRERRPVLGGPQIRRIVSIDPGVRTFATCYSPTATEDKKFTDYGKSGPKQAIGYRSRTTTKEHKKESHKWGLGSVIMFTGRKIARIEASANKCSVLAKEQPKHSKEARKLHKKAHSKRKAIARLRLNLQNKIADMHWRVCNELCASNDIILLPNFRPSQMVRKFSMFGKNKKGRKIGKKTVRMMLGLCHSKFRDRLLSKAEEYNTHVEIVTEDYTSQTCGSCGKLHRELKDDKVFICPHCGWTLGRDQNGARNILLRFLTAAEVAKKLRAEFDQSSVRPPPYGVI